MNVNSLDETRELARELASSWDVGTVVRLQGGLGVGKTTFTQFVARALGVTGFVGSPTFKLISEYRGAGKKLYHADCYRLKSPREFLEIGGESYLYPEDGITLIEWPENIDPLIPQSAVQVTIARNRENPRVRQFRITTG